jgi:hypothetical protein
LANKPGQAFKTPMPGRYGVEGESLGIERLPILLVKYKRDNQTTIQGTSACLGGVIRETANINPKTEIANARMGQVSKKECGLIRNMDRTV